MKDNRVEVMDMWEETTGCTLLEVTPLTPEAVNLKLDEVHKYVWDLYDRVREGAFVDRELVRFWLNEILNLIEKE